MSDLEKYLAERLAGVVAEQARAIADQLLQRELAQRDWRRLGAVSIEEAGVILGGLSRTTVCRLLDEGTLAEFSTTDGGRRMVTVHSIRRRLREV